MSHAVSRTSSLRNLSTFPSTPKPNDATTCQQVVVRLRCCSGVYNGVGFVKGHVSGYPVRAGSGVKGGPASFAGPFIADP